MWAKAIISNIDSEHIPNSRMYNTQQFNGWMEWCLFNVHCSTFDYSMSEFLVGGKHKKNLPRWYSASTTFQWFRLPSVNDLQRLLNFWTTYISKIAHQHIIIRFSKASKDQVHEKKKTRTNERRKLDDEMWKHNEVWDFSVAIVAGVCIPCTKSLVCYI